MADAAAGFALATSQAQAPFFKNDLEVLNFALTLEHLEDRFYRDVNNSGKLQGKVAQALTVIGLHEKLHVDGLTATILQLGGTPVREQQSYNFAAVGDMGTQAGILAIANVLEPTGVKAYDGTAPEIMDKLLLAIAGQIVQVEARHAAIIRVLLDPNANPVPNAFEEMATPQQILDAVKPILGG